ncbi:anti-anti-sigma factor [Streptomyces sp. BK208]|uniref:STAS domain-containing protein n=1 Tax=Streptomyces sp. BK208 TaxID=2512150 RepID=UPI00106107DD|nr:STAS domain-containing protein [Streptomyces sp. BK208]TDT35251.1 anti-anti-sigma factor [Streptomyces sp. BK208]
MTKHPTLHTRTTTAGPVVEIAGDLDYDTADQVRAGLLGLGLLPGQQLVLDLGSLSCCDSSGISVLIAARNHALASGAGIALAAVPDRLDRTFRLVGLERTFPTHPTAEAAEAAWRLRG